MSTKKWFIKGTTGNGNIIIQNKHGDCLGYADEYSKASKICTAVNNHNKLFKALKLAVKHYVGVGRNSKNVFGKAGIAADFIHRVIKQVEGK